MLQIKITYEGEIRRTAVSASSSFADVVRTVSSLFGVDERQAVLKYTDDEGDLVTMSSQPEFAAAVALTRSSGLLRLTLTEGKTPVTVPPQIPNTPSAAPPKPEEPAEEPTPEGLVHTIDPAAISRVVEILRAAEAKHGAMEPAAVEELVNIATGQVERIAHILPAVVASMGEGMCGMGGILPMLCSVASDPTKLRSFVRDCVTGFIRGPMFPFMLPFALQVLSNIQNSGQFVDICLEKTDEKPAEEKPKENNRPIHYGVICDCCENIIMGDRYKCSACPDYDLCSTCKVKPGVHDASHLFTKIPFPVHPRRGGHHRGGFCGGRRGGWFGRFPPPPPCNPPCWFPAPPCTPPPFPPHQHPFMGMFGFPPPPPPCKYHHTSHSPTGLQAYSYSYPHSSCCSSCLYTCTNSATT
ncbi:sequestosome 1 [Pelomyxa schiedti]|nr:sequestosome 1 [Pelomyxa schiedti]